MTTEEIMRWETILDAVENPCLSKDVGAPGSLMRRANDLGRELARLRKLEKPNWRTIIDAAKSIKVAGPWERGSQMGSTQTSRSHARRDRWDRMSIWPEPPKNKWVVATVAIAALELVDRRHGFDGKWGFSKSSVLHATAEEAMAAYDTWLRGEGWILT